MSTPRQGHAVLAEIRLRAGLYLNSRADLLTTTRTGTLESGWSTTTTPPTEVPHAKRHTPGDTMATTLASLVRLYATLADRDHQRLTINPRFPQSVELDIRHAPMKCPQCGATSDGGGGKLEGMLERWHDSQGSGWQCHNGACQWYAVDDEIE